MVYHDNMKFEFDADKSLFNKQKHGMDFVDGQVLWDDWDLLEIPARTLEDEDRCLVVGTIGATHWSAALTYIVATRWGSYLFGVREKER